LSAYTVVCWFISCAPEAIQELKHRIFQISSMMLYRKTGLQWGSPWSTHIALRCNRIHDKYFFKVDSGGFESSININGPAKTGCSTGRKMHRELC
jgi:hypothetical protein